MLERFTKVLYECNFKSLEQHFENEDVAKKILLNSINNTEEEQQERRKFLNKKLEQRKNLYIYPEKVNV